MRLVSPKFSLHRTDRGLFQAASQNILQLLTSAARRRQIQQGHGGLDFPWAKGGRGGDRASVVTCKAFLEVCRKSRVVMGLRGYVGEDTDIQEGHWE